MTATNLPDVHAATVVVVVGLALNYNNTDLRLVASSGCFFSFLSFHVPPTKETFRSQRHGEKRRYEFHTLLIRRGKWILHSIRVERQVGPPPPPPPPPLPVCAIHRQLVVMNRPGSSFRQSPVVSSGRR